MGGYSCVFLQVYVDSQHSNRLNAERRLTMYVLICNRVVKRNTGSTEKFAPRTANYESLKVSGPFRSFKAAQRAAETALSTHTCLDAQVWNAEQVAEHQQAYRPRHCTRPGMLGVLRSFRGRANATSAPRLIQWQGERRPTVAWSIDYESYTNRATGGWRGQGRHRAGYA